MAKKHIARTSIFIACEGLGHILVLKFGQEVVYIEV
jgi:hypothetical protein